MKLNKNLALALALPLFLTACPGKKETPPPAATEPMVPATPADPNAPAGENAAPADPNAAAASPSATEGGTGK